jgi:hypothetical protein
MTVEEERRSGGLERIQGDSYICTKASGRALLKRAIEPTERHPSLVNVTPEQHREKGYIQMPLSKRNVVSPLYSVLSF